MLNAIICTWNEEDIIAACVANAKAQGCERVFILDNASTDRTVQQAIRAGAVYQATFKTDEFDETQKTVYLNKCVTSINEQLPDETAWWLYLDADEFPDCDNGKTIRETLYELPPDARAVGSYVCNHLPTHAPYCVPGMHPADFMPLGRCEKDKIWKFNLLRHDKGKPPIYSRSGAHTYNGNGAEIVEAEQRLLTHHFNYRRPEVTRKRLEALILPGANGKSRVAWYDRMSKVEGRERSHYHERLEQMERVYADNRYGNLKTDALEYNYRLLPRWYDPLSAETEAKIGAIADMGELERWICLATQACFMRDFNLALPRFIKAQEATDGEFPAELLLDCISRCQDQLG